MEQLQHFRTEGKLAIVKESGNNILNKEFSPQFV
jgi:hypothetical protein